MKRLLAMLCALLVLSAPALAHSGKTDGKGGHYNRSTGEYHYHHGYSAHQHPDGVCPYDFKDKTDHSSGGGKPSLSAKTVKPTTTLEPTKKKSSGSDDVLLKIGVAAGYIFLMFVLPLILHSRDNRKR